MSDEKEVTQTIESGVPAKPVKKRACVDHCKRFWWLHLIIFVLVSVLVICLIIFVAVPKIAQAKVNDAELEIQGVNVLDTKPDSYLMQINSTIKTDGKVKADIDPFVGNLYLEDVPNAPAFATLDFPATNGDEHQIVNVSQVVRITDEKAFEQFNIDFFQRKNLTIRIQGNTQIQPKGLNRKSSVEFKKVLTVNGLNLLNGTKVVGGKVDFMAKSGENNFHGTAEIPNNSHFTLDIGNATFINYADNQELGKLTITNLVLRPGINKVAVAAAMDQVKIVQILAKKPYCETGIIPFQLLGSDVQNNGKQIPYFLAALSSANQTVPIDIAGILGIEASCPTTTSS
ncbi:hypothetical protein DCS_07565 [Drechmeria coniospora]|uniref:Pre-rRNA processing protein n=1 Tax=Drechmeria coniospora TaxID=98403 RepID=A0A151GEV9_DRECN|nr:hypothetical protein DCS_07565 [Drechmeria coniospora]KYK55602.1 hypothetical protein DCS_07565 [Drechmeria coniospora]